jgi:hypothetical protein
LQILLLSREESNRLPKSGHLSRLLLKCRPQLLSGQFFRQQGNAEYIAALVEFFSYPIEFFGQAISLSVGRIL